jgi:ribosomal-protein-serine acetyltransferase
VKLGSLSADLGGMAALRPLGESDVAELFALVDANREYLRAWLPWVDSTRREEDVRAFVADSSQKAAQGVSVQFAIVEGGRIAGVIGFHEIDRPHAQVGIGYWVAEDRQGRGLVTRAVEALLGMAFDELGLNRVEIHVATENARSRAIPERLRFRHEGVLRQAERLYDRFVDLDAYALIASEWRRRPP